MYSIVIFKETTKHGKISESVAAIPTSWIFEDEGNVSCAWPDNEKLFKQLVKKCSDPLDHWKRLPCRVKENNLQFNQLQMGCKRALEFTDNNSESEEDSNGFSEDDLLPSPPKKKKLTSKYLALWKYFDKIMVNII